MYSAIQVSLENTYLEIILVAYTIVIHKDVLLNLTPKAHFDTLPKGVSHPVW